MVDYFTNGTPRASSVFSMASILFSIWKKRATFFAGSTWRSFSR